MDLLCPKRVLIAAAALTVAPTGISALQPSTITVSVKGGGKDIPAVDPADTPEVQAKATKCAKVYNDLVDKQVVTKEDVVEMWKSGDGGDAIQKKVQPLIDSAGAKAEKDLVDDPMGPGMDWIKKLDKYTHDLEKECHAPPGVGRKPSAATASSVSILAAVGTGLFVLFF